MAYLSIEELKKIGFASFGNEVYISDKASIHNPGKISIGSYVRIDDFALLSAGEGGIEIGSFIHISCYACLIGKSKITIHDFVGISIKATILSSNSDFSGRTLPDLGTFEFDVDEREKDLLTVNSEPVVLETHTGLGAHTVVLPGVTIGQGTVVGAQSVVYEPLNSWGIYNGNPARFIKKRDQEAFNRIRGIKDEDRLPK